MSLTTRSLHSREAELDVLSDDELVCFWNVQTRSNESLRDTLAMQTLLTERGIPFKVGKLIKAKWAYTTSAAVHLTNY